MHEDELRYCVDFEHSRLVFRRESARERRELVYEPELCTGCGLCYEACPVDAISLGATGAAVARGIEGLVPVEIDPERCVLCGMCAGVCMFRAITVRVDGEDVRESRRFPKLLRAFLFEQDKCSLRDDGSACDECMQACPAGAITFAGIKGERNTIERDDSKCIFCSSCAQACPKDAIAVEKVFEGEVSVDDERCTGCGTCVEICPAKALSMPQSKPWEKVPKIAVRQEVCILCGACRHACPVDAIEVRREKVRYELGEQMSWTRSWEKTFRRL